MNVINPDNIANSVFQGFINQLGIDSAVSDMISLLVVGIPAHIVNQALNRAVQATVKPIVRMALMNVGMFIPAPLLMYTAATTTPVATAAATTSKP